MRLGGLVRVVDGGPAEQTLDQRRRQAGHQLPAFLLDLRGRHGGDAPPVLLVDGALLLRERRGAVRRRGRRLRRGSATLPEGRLPDALPVSRKAGSRGGGPGGGGRGGGGGGALLDVADQAEREGGGGMALVVVVVVEVEDEALAAEGHGCCSGTEMSMKTARRSDDAAQGRAGRYAASG